MISAASRPRLYLQPGQPGHPPLPRSRRNARSSRLASPVREIDEAVARGWAERDASSFLLIQEERARVAVRLPTR
jgi:hypothetical protein